MSILDRFIENDLYNETRLDVDSGYAIRSSMGFMQGICQNWDRVNIPPIASCYSLFVDNVGEDNYLTVSRASGKCYAVARTEAALKEACQKELNEHGSESVVISTYQCNEGVLTIHLIGQAGLVDDLDNRVAGYFIPILPVGYNHILVEVEHLVMDGETDEEPSTINEALSKLPIAMTPKVILKVLKCTFICKVGMTELLECFTDGYIAEKDKEDACRTVSKHALVYIQDYDEFMKYGEQ